MPIKEYEKYRQYLRTLTVKGLQQKFYQQTNPLYLTMMDKLTFSFALWPEKSGHFFIYRRLYLSGIWTPLVRASLRFYGQWQV